jgi:hypothetical protein
MSVLRISKKQQNFLILDKTCLQDKNLSWAAKGLHTYLMSLPDDWRVQVSDLQNRAKNGRDAVRGTLKELEGLGYIKKSRQRNDENGRFDKVEYLVLEVPEFIVPMQSPETPFQALADLEGFPRPENPCTGNPSPENTTLISNKVLRIDNNNLITAADVKKEIKVACKAEALSAAVFSFQKNKEPQKTKEPSLHELPIQTLSKYDALIGEALSVGQKERIMNMVAQLNIDNKEALIDEVAYCISSAKCFSGCGRDFSKKINAVRSVILKGHWQTPIGMCSDVAKPVTSKADTVRLDLQSAQAELRHFQRLFSTATDPVKQGFDKIIKNTELKIMELEKSIIKK